MKTTDFDYELPAGLIAQSPAEPRDSAQLMIVDRSSGSVEHRVFRQITTFLQPGDLLVLNNTRVLPARLLAVKAGTGGRAEILLLEQLGPRTWLALVGGRRLTSGTELVLLSHEGEPSSALAVVREARTGAQRVIEFNRPANEWLAALGHAPLPPYIHGYQGDPERYQTVYAKREGSAAAPTAGLHFTPELLLQIRELGIKIAFVELRIGLDTFKPIDSDCIEDHLIHTEWAQLTTQVAKQINQTKLAGGRVIAVGTTTVRTLESAGRLANPSSCEGETCGWRAISAFAGPTDLYITPGFRFQVVDALLTNFHLPRSSLIVLVSAFSGTKMSNPADGLALIKHAYATAIERKYRFYSFGDAMLIL